MEKNRGFTLVELTVVIAIIGILASVVYPSITAYVKIIDRSDGMDALLREAGRMEAYYMDNDSYTGATVASASSKGGFYTITLSNQDDFVYLLTATRTPSTADPECLTLTMNQLGQKGATGSDVASCW